MGFNDLEFIDLTIKTTFHFLKNTEVTTSLKRKIDIIEKKY